MIVIDIEKHIAGTRQEVQCPKDGFTSFRALLASDGLGFSMSKTVIPRGETQHWHYKNHREACYCVSGLGLLTDDATGDNFVIRPDVVYAANEHDSHHFVALEDVVLICVFNPPLTGRELHDADGSYDVV